MTNTTISSIVEPAVIKVGGKMLPDETMANLMDVRVQLVLNGASQATVRLYDADFEILDAATFDPGTPITIGFARTAQVPTVLFDGEIVAIAAEQGPGDLHELVVTCFDKAHRMGRSTEAKTYQSVTYANVISQIARAHGLRSKIPGGFAPTVHPYLLQMTDDASFISDLVRRGGGQWRVADGTIEVFQISQQAPVAELRWGTDLLRFRSRLNASAATDEISALGWDPLTKRTIRVKAAPRSTPGLSAPVGLTNGRPRGTAFPKAKRAGSRQVFTSVQEANDVTKAQRFEADALAVHARGDCIGNAVLQPGKMVKVTGMGSRLSGNYLMTEVEHVYNPNGYVTRFTAGPLTSSTLPDLVGSSGTPTTHLSPVVGIVTNNLDRNRQGVVRVSFPTFGDNIESAWARVIGLGAGKSRGLLMLPAVDDEVLVVFEGGDYRRPVVIGGLWNGQDVPQIQSDVTTKRGEVVQWAMTSAKGQQILFDDSNPQTMNITVAMSGQRTRLYVGKDKVELFAENTSIELKSGQADVLLNGKTGDVTITATNINLTARQSVKINANATVEINGTGQAKLTGGMVEVVGNATVSVGAMGKPTSVAGTPVKIN